MTTAPTRRFRQTAMAPSRRNEPMTEVDQLQDLLRSFLRDPFGTTGEQAPGWIPAADIEETDDAYILELDVPGLQREDVDIQLRDSEVRITGEIKEKERTGLLRRQTRRVGRFEFGMTLPGDINPDRVDATLRHGVLTVRLGKATASQPRQVEVKD
jgi:HSP20 family protein